MLVALLVALPAPARAQPAASEPGESDPRDPEPGESEYRRLVSLALDEFEARRWAEGRALFRRAHAAQPNARTLRGIAMTSFELREYSAAIRAIDAALAHPRRPLTEAQRAHVLELRERAEAFVARYTLEGAPPGARVLVDGVPIPTSHRRLTVDLGEHTVRVVAEGHRPWERRVRVAGGERERLRAALEPVPATARLTVPAASHDDTAAHGLLVGAGGGLVGTGVATGYWVSREIALGRCETRPCTNAEAIRSERDAGLALTVGLGVVSVGLGVVGLLLLLLERRAPAAEASLGCTTLGLGVRCSGRL